MGKHSITDRLDNLFGRWGLPSAVTTDNGPQFASMEFTEFLKLRSIKHIGTAVYHPESNGGVERLELSKMESEPVWRKGNPSVTHSIKLS